MAELEEQSHVLLGPAPEQLASVKVFPLIIHLKKDVLRTIDSALSWEQLTASDINFAIVRPLVFKYARLNNLAIVYVCFVIRSHFLSEAEENLAYSGVMLSRASLCEILAMKLLNHFATNQLQLVSSLTASWSPLMGAPTEIMDEVRDVVGNDDDMHDPQCALEMAIATESKTFISSPVVQTVVNDIYAGRVVFSMTSNRSVLADNYKPKATEFYDVRTAPFLDHYRLRVPRYGAMLEFINFAILLLLFVSCLGSKESTHLTGVEIAFIIFASAFALEEYTASREHGWEIYIANLWNVFDSSFILIFLAYLVNRIRGLAYGNVDASEFAFDILACGGCILFPRLAFFAVSNNVVVLALRAMIAEFVFFIGIAAICFSGLLFTLHSLAAEKWSVKSIAWLMVQIWFGNTYLSFGQAESFHPVFGPILMTGFAALSNTLLLTILISILSNTFARIDANANQEYLFQFAISTIEGVKSDALFSYQPPFNLFAFLILWPLSCVLSPRALHTVNVFLIKLTSFPQLIVIGIYERYLREGQGWRKQSDDTFNSFSRRMKNMPFIEHIVGSSTTDLYDAIFDVDVSESQGLDIFDDQDGTDADDDRAEMRSIASQESTGDRSGIPFVISPPAGSGTPGAIGRRPSSVPRAPNSPSGRSIRSTGRLEAPSPNGSPRPRRVQLPTALQPSLSGEIPTYGPRSPLSRLYNGRTVSSVSQSAAAQATTEAGIKKLEAAVEEIKGLPVNKLKEEMKELQERQARIENLLLMLTRGMRNDTGHHSNIRHDTL
ncbi:hypothetical protein EUX98_g6581 [Antrodiella citrinella]|uniref:Polycystin cation channel PKD1/PKD2 domain-containing protein n=1 Tax=Antrodiella citrinella TaxID=2447956 RepID=A0A4S4MNM6_9APHY|nr:hypothetical protein EUX98_g6581 [Antrodiella citrinella]